MIPSTCKNYSARVFCYTAGLYLVCTSSMQSSCSSRCECNRARRYALVHIRFSCSCFVSAGGKSPAVHWWDVEGVWHHKGGATVSGTCRPSTPPLLRMGAHMCVGLKTGHCLRNGCRCLLQHGGVCMSMHGVHGSAWRWWACGVWLGGRGGPWQRGQGIGVGGWA